MAVAMFTTASLESRPHNLDASSVMDGRMRLPGVASTCEIRSTTGLFMAPSCAMPRRASLTRLRSSDTGARMSDSDSDAASLRSSRWVPRSVGREDTASSL